MPRLMFFIVKILDVKWQWLCNVKDEFLAFTFSIVGFIINDVVLLTALVEPPTFCTV